MIGAPLFYRCLYLFLSLSIALVSFPLDARPCHDKICFKKKRYRELAITGGVAVGGLASYAIAKSIWPITHNRHCGCAGVTPTPGPTPTSNTGPAQLTFAFNEMITPGSPVTWTGSVILPTQQVVSTGTFAFAAPPSNGTLVIGPPSPIGTYMIIFFVDSNTSPATATELGTVVETNSPSGSTVTYTTPVAPSVMTPAGYVTGSQVTFEFVYNPSVNP